MAVGKKYGGRVKGTPNRPKGVLLTLLQKHYPGYHPVLEMAQIAHDEESSKELKAQMHKEVAQYVAPKLKAMEITGADGGPVHTVISAQPMTQDDWESMYAKPEEET